MKAHTSQFKEDIKTIGKQLDSKIIYELDGVVQTLTSEQLNSITPTFQGAILKSVMKELDIDSNVDIPIGTEVNYQFGLKTEGDFEYVNYGNYIVYSSEKQEDYDSYKIVCYDKMLYSMKKNEDLGITYPKTIRDYMNTLCNKLGLEFKNKNDEFANFDRQIGEELYAGQDYTYRDIFDQLAEVTASTICLDENDKVEIRYINDLTDLYTVNGKEVTFESDIEYPMSFQVNGKSEQDGTPTPDYPQEIENVRGVENLIKNTNVNSGDGNYWASFSTFDEENRILTRSTTLTTESFIMHKLNGLKSGTTYTLYLEAKSNGYVKNMDLYCFNKDTKGIKQHQILNLTQNFTKYTWTFTTDKTIDYSDNASIRIDNNGSTVSGTEAILTIKDVVLVEGNVILATYVPYGSNYLRIDNVGKNFFDKDNAIKGFYYDALGGLSPSVNWYYENIRVKPNTSYSISGNTTNNTTAYFVELNKNLELVKKIGNYYNTHNFTTSNETYYVGVSIPWYGDSDGRNNINTFQVEKGSTATSYEPYKSESTLIDLKGNELCSNKDKTVKDNLFVTNKGKVEIFKKIGKVVLDGSESGWNLYTEGFGFNVTSLNIKPKLIEYCDKYIVDNTYSSFITKDYAIGYIYSSASLLYIRNKDYTSLADFKTWLSNNPVTVYYVLKTPETIELDPVTPLKSYIGQNNISNNAGADMNVTYSKNYETIDVNFLKDINVNFGEKYGPVNSIVLSRSAESDNIYLQDEESITKNGLCEIKIKDNQIMNWNDRSDYLPDILEKLDGLEYYLNDFVSTGIAYLDLCDKYNVNVFENNYPCIMFNDELLVTQGLEENVHTDMPEETQTDYTKSDKTDRRINQAYIIVDKQQQEITSLTKQTNSIQDNLTNNYYTREQSNILIQNAQSGLTNTFSEAGGNNIFRNTGLWFSQSDANNPYEYWTGNNVSKQNTDKSSNGSLMMLKKGTLEQEQVVSNGNYTVSFKYKKLIQLATCKVIVNDNEYELTQMADTEWQTGSKDADGNIVIKPLEVTSNHINVKFTSTVDNAIEIYDLMVNAGTVKLAYSQNENEVTTDTVNISKGITITSSANDTKFKANADGIRIVDKNNEKTILTEFTDKGMSTKEMEVENGATIVKVLVQNVGSQTWFTRI